LAGAPATPFARIGTRGSPLARRQAEMVRDLLAAAHGVPATDIAIEIITTSGDKLVDRPLSEAGGKGLFSKEIEAALLAGQVDIGVHSSKDLATRLPDGLMLAAFLEREDVRDAFVSLSAASLADLPQGARFGSSSIRRAAQLGRHRPDLVIVPFRGNVDTRLNKLRDGVADATLLAVAGLNRLGRQDAITAYLDPRDYPPAPAQGAIGLEIRSGDARVAALVAPLHHHRTGLEIAAERGLLATLDGSCRTPIGAFTEIAGGSLTLTAEILSADGRQHFTATLGGPAADGEALGRALGDKLLGMAGVHFLDQFRG